MLNEACTKAELGYLERRKVMLCDQAVAASAPPPELLEARYNLAKAGEPASIAGGRDLLCGLRQLGLKAVFEDDSGLFSSGAKVTLTALPKSAGADVFTEPYAGTGMPPITITFSSEDDANGPYWQSSGMEADGAPVPAGFDFSRSLGCVVAGNC